MLFRSDKAVEKAQKVLDDIAEERKKVEAAQSEQALATPANEDIFQMAERAVNENKEKPKGGNDILFRESDEVNRKFNEQLSDFTIESADNFIFDLGHPSDILLSAGIRNLPIRLHGSKVAKKMKKHKLKNSMKIVKKIQMH